MIKTKAIQYFIVILIVPLYFLLTEYLNLPILKIFLSVLIFYFLFGYIVVFPLGWNEFTQIQWSEMPVIIIWEILYVIVGTTFLAYLFNIYALKVLSPTVASTYIYLQPILASIFAIWMGKDSITGLKVLATVLIFIGVYLVSKRSYKRV